MELFVIIVNGFQLLTIITKRSILDVAAALDPPLVLFAVLWFKWPVKEHFVAKVLQAIWEIFLHENNQGINSYRFSDKLAFIHFLSFLTNQNENQV